MQHYKKILKPFSRKLRTDMTDTEQLLWSRLRRKQISDLQFYRQKPIAGYIADFYCAAINLVIELDGSQHHEQENKANDVERDRVMHSLGLQILRFDNLQVMNELDAVMDKIVQVVEERLNG
jgi:very-short-patch-repair endonuclease